MAKDVKFNIRLTIDGKEQIVTATQCIKNMKDSVSESQSTVKNAMSVFNDWGNTLRNTSSAVGNLQSVMSSLASGYQASLQANTQLTTVMRQRMDATSEDIAQVKEVVAVQKELGVVSGTVQIRGAQQMATFLGQKRSLMTLIPAMNNLIAQQKGVNATQEDAYGIANLMGRKVCLKAVG